MVSRFAFSQKKAGCGAPAVLDHNALCPVSVYKELRMQANPKRIVRAGYDAAADNYADWLNRIEDPERERWTGFLIEQLPEGSHLLDLGCGNGTPTTLRLAEHVSVTGIDISARQIELARDNVPAATFICADLMDVSFPPAHFDAVTAFYSIIHLPREEQPDLLRRIAGWLVPGGYSVIVMGASDAPDDVDPDWLGVPMYWSHYPPQVNLAMVRESGLTVVSSDVVTLDEPEQPATFHWLVARKSI
jgi:SAM-dependent methyltransferase